MTAGAFLSGMSAGYRDSEALKEQKKRRGVLEAMQQEGGGPSQNPSVTPYWQQDGYQGGADPQSRGVLPNGASGGGGKYGNMTIDGSSGASAAMGMLRSFEGFSDKPYWDVNADRTGYGSDTITRSDGSIVPVQKGMRVTREDAERDLHRRVSTEFLPSARRAIGDDVFNSLNANQQGVLTSLAYNYGAGAWGDSRKLKGVADAVKSRDPDRFRSAMERLQGHNDGINSERRRKEMELFLADLSARPARPAAAQQVARGVTDQFPVGTYAAQEGVGPR